MNKLQLLLTLLLIPLTVFADVDGVPVGTFDGVTVTSYTQVDGAVSAGGSETWTYITTITKDGGDTDTVTMDSALNIAAGDLIFADVVYRPSGTQPTITMGATTGEANTTTTICAYHDYTSGSYAHGAFAYKINASANSTSTFQIDLSVAQTGVRVIIMQWRPTGTVSLVASSNGSVATGNSTAPASNTISPSGSSLLVFGGGGSYYGMASSGLIGGGAADQATYGAETSGNPTPILFAEEFASSQTDISASWTQSSVRNWYAHIVAFKNE